MSLTGSFACKQLRLIAQVAFDHSSSCAIDGVVPGQEHKLAFLAASIQIRSMHGASEEVRGEEKACRLIHLAIKLSALLLIPDFDGSHSIGVDDDQNQGLGAERGAVAVPIS